MVTTTTNIPIPGEVWIELYTASSISSGTSISTQNIGVNDLYYSVSATEPPRDSDKYRIFKRGQVIEQVDNDKKIWVFSPQSPGLINVEILGYTNFPLGFNQQVAEGRVNGYSFVAKFGENPDIDAASGFETIWDGGGTYIPPTQARIHDCVSTNVADAGTLVSSGMATGGTTITLEDTGATFITDGVALGDVILNDTNCEIGIVTAITSETVLRHGFMRNPNTGMIGQTFESGDSYRVVTDAGVGAGIMYIKGLNASFLSTNEFVIMDGTNNVPTVSSYTRMFRARAFGANTTGAVGILTATAQVDGTVSCQIINGNNQSLMSIYTVPFGKIGYLAKWWGSISKKQISSSIVRLRAGTLDGLGYILQTRAITTSGSSEFNYSYTISEPLAGGVDVWVEADSDSNDVGITSGFDLILKDS